MAAEPGLGPRCERELTRHGNLCAVAASVSSVRATARAAWLRAWGPNVVGLAWMLAVAVAVLTPALIHGVHLGPYDLLSQYGLSKRPGVVVHNWTATDQITEMIPWSTLAWTQVHHGHLPLWNPYSGLGMPLAFNWQSAPFSLPALLGYLVPVRFSYTIGVVATLFISGTGGYVLGRVLRLGVIASILVGTVFELSGPVAGGLGFPLASVDSWAGWLFAAALLVVRGKHRARDIAFFAVALAFALYAGNPDAVSFVLLALVLFLIPFLALRARWLGGSGLILRPVTDLLLATAAGAGLAAPLLLPGLQLTGGSIHSTTGLIEGFPVHPLVHVIFQGFDGLPVVGNQWFGSSNITDYYASDAYVGLIAAVLAVTAVAVHRRRPEVISFAGVAIVMALLGFVLLHASFIRRLPLVGPVEWTLALTPMALALAVLAGVGMDALVRLHGERAVRRWIGAGFAAAALLLVALFIFSQGHLTPEQADLRSKSFIWPVIQTGLGLVVTGVLVVVHHRNRRGEAQRPRLRSQAGRWAALALLGCETAFLLAAGAPLWSSSPRFLSPTPPEVALQRAVKGGVVGFGSRSCIIAYPGLGIPPNVNTAYGVQELGVYDPILPKAYYQSWRAATGETGGIPLFALFCPTVTNATVARRYGVAFVLEHSGAPGPQGGVFDTKVGDEDLYRIPGAAAATLTALPASGAFPSPDAMGRPLTFTHPDPAAWNLTTSSSTPEALRLRLTDVPGWQATIDGQPLQLVPFSGLMLQARIPPGRHTIELHYWPTAFTVGIVLAICSLGGLLAALLIGTRSGRGPHKIRTGMLRGPRTWPAAQVTGKSSASSKFG